MWRSGSRAAAGVDHRASKAANVPRCRRSMARNVTPQDGPGPPQGALEFRPVRVLHLTDRLSQRGGAHRHLHGIVDWLVGRGHDVHVAAGADDGACYECATSIVPGLEARGDASVDLAPLMVSFRP